MPTTHFSHPGGILLREFLEPLELRPGTLATAIGVDRTRIKSIIDGDRDISADTALRLARYFGNSANFWMNLQAQYDLALALSSSRREINRITQHQTLSNSARLGRSPSSQRSVA